MNQKIIDELNSYIDANRDNITADLAAIASIESVSLDGDPVKPFGPGCIKVLDAMLADRLDEGIALFNRGIELSKQCMQLLNESKGKVALLKKELDAVTSVAFDVDADNN